MESFNLENYIKQTETFPNITFEEFETITDRRTRTEIVKKNRILQTDAYNRTMGHMRKQKGKETETYTLTFRRSPNDTYNIIYGVKNTLKQLFSNPITQAELDFAKAVYKKHSEEKGVPYFDEAMRQDIIDTHDGYIPLSISSVLDGTALKPQEPILHVTGPGEVGAHFEPSLIPIFYQSVVATDAAYLDEIIRDGRVIEVGKRAAFNEDMHIDALEALFVGGGLTHTSNDAAATIFPQLTTVGTIGHRYLSSYATENEAFANAVEAADIVSLLVDMADSYSGIRKAITIKTQQRKNTLKLISQRLDSGDLIDQAIYALTLQHEAGLIDPKRDKIIIEGIEDIHEFRKIDQAIKKAGFDPRKWIIYGSGEVLIAKNKLRSAVSTGYKLTNTIDGPTGKISNSPGKEPIPGIPNVEIRESERVIVQEDETMQGKRLLQKVYENGVFYYKQENDLLAMNEAQERVRETMKDLELPSTKSKTTKEIHKQVRKKLLANIQHAELPSITTESSIIQALQLNETASQQKKYKNTEEVMYLDNGRYFVDYIITKLLGASDNTLRMIISYPNKITLSTSYGGHGGASGDFDIIDILGNITGIYTNSKFKSQKEALKKKIASLTGKTIEELILESNKNT